MNRQLYYVWYDMSLKAKRIDDVAPTLLANLGEGDYVNCSVAPLVIEKMGDLKMQECKNAETFQKDETE